MSVEIAVTAEDIVRHLDKLKLTYLQREMVRAAIRKAYEIELQERRSTS